MWINGALPGVGLMLLIILAFYFFYRAFHTRKLARLREELEATWGKESLVFRDIGRISTYDNHLHGSAGKDQGSRKRMNDLNMDAVFAKLDRCKTKIGQQFLYALLHNPVSDRKELETRDQGINYFEQNKESLLALQIELQQLNAQLSYAIPNILFEWKLDHKNSKLLAGVLSCLPLGSVFDFV